MDYLIKFISQILAWLLSFVGWVLTETAKLVMAALAAIVNAIPVPDWFANAGGAVANIPPGVAYLISSMHIESGAGIMVSAYTIRFLIRRIPIIG
jgi:hypothetical protein